MRFSLLIILSMLSIQSCLWGQDDEKIAITPCEIGENCEDSDEWYTAEELLNLIVLHIFHNISDLHNKHFTELRTKTVISMMQIHHVQKASDVRTVTPPSAWTCVLPVSQKTCEPTASLLLSKKNIEKIDKDYGKKFASAFKSYCKKLEKMQETETAPATLNWNDSLNAISIIIQEYNALPSDCRDKQDPEEKAYLHKVFERLAARLYIMQQAKLITISAEQQKNIYNIVKTCSISELKQILKLTVKENGLPRPLSTFNEQKSAELWFDVIQKLYKSN